jgi:hypothetical protein
MAANLFEALVNLATDSHHSVDFIIFSPEKISCQLKTGENIEIKSSLK